MAEEFCARLKLLREDKGVEQQQVSLDLGLSKNACHKWESGKSEPNLKYLEMIADYFDATVDYLLGRTSNKQGVIRYDIPQELLDLGVQYLTVTKEAKDRQITPEELQKLINVVTELKKGP